MRAGVGFCVVLCVVFRVMFMVLRVVSGVVSGMRSVVVMSGASMAAMVATAREGHRSDDHARRRCSS
jgi:hypothetical protein